ncbi:conserved hypothetical protein [Echinococcus multilocularis]|uniref:Uncharacterized protein n=1 Tax=Echinococcus multilocularis TaxID=6211 RepID=A0A068Y1L6_ECHMU|nr:conserved hypothetical protein [Echinococcus multilocularis]
MSTPPLRRNSLRLPSTTSVRVSLQSFASPLLDPQPLSRTPMSSTAYIPGRGSFAERKPPHVILPITPTPPPLPPPPPNPQLAPLKPRSRSQQWTSSKAFGIVGVGKLPVRSHSVKVPASKRSGQVPPPPRPLTRPKLLEERKSRLQATPTTAASISTTTINAQTATPTPTSYLRQDVFRVTFYVFHSSLLLVSYLAWTAFFILLLPAFCVSYCIRQIGLLLAQHRRTSLVETLSSLSLHYIHGEDAGRNTVVVIYLGSPGIKIAALKRLLVQRIFSTDSTATEKLTPNGSPGMEKWFSERLQQTVVPLPTGYAWQRCSSVNIDEHVVPAYLVGQNRLGYGRRLSPKKRPPEEEGMVEVEKDPVEMLVGQLAAVELPLDRPLWQVHLVEDYCDTKDALTVRRVESPFSPSSWQDKDFLAPWRNSRPNQTPSDTHSVNFADRLGGFRQGSPALSICSSRSVAGSSTVGRHGMGTTPTGSLIVFRVHSAITDDAQSLVEFLTILLSEGIYEEGNRSPVNFPEPGTSNAAKGDEISKDSTSPIFKVRISESSLEWQGHPEKSPPPITVQEASSIRTYSTCFCAWLREVNAMRREVTRAFLLGPFLMLHNLMMVPADLGLLPSLVRPAPSEVEAATTVVQRQVFRRIQLPLDKVLHVQKVTKASFSEISMSLLSGALRAYQQTSGLKSPLDLLIRTCTPTPNFELCCERLLHLNRHRDTVEGEVSGHESEHHEALTALNEIANGPPAHCIFTPMQLPLSEEGMIPRLWRVHQRMMTLQRTALAVTMAWTRDLLHLLLPHGLALRADSLLLSGSSKCSVTFAEVSLENTDGAEGSISSMLGKRSKYGGRKRSKSWLQSRRSWLSGQNVLKMDISQALRLVNRPNSPQTSTVYDENSSNERNLDLLYLSGGVPIVRIEAWLANHHGASAFDKSSFSNSSSFDVAAAAGSGNGKATMCRDLAVVTCAYGSHLTVGLTASCQMDGTPGVDLILNTMLKQLNNLYKLLDSRFPAKPVIYAPHRRIHLAAGASSSSARTRTIQSSVRTHNRPQTASDSTSPQLSPATLHESPTPDAIGGELTEDRGNQFLKYNFPPLSSSLRRSSLRRRQKRRSNGALAVQEAADEAGGALKFVPIIKPPSTAKKTEAKSQTKRKGVDESSRSVTTKKTLESTGLVKSYRRFSLARKVKKRPAKPPSPNLRKSQVRFVTEED